MNIFLVLVVTTLYILHFFSVSPSKESAVVKQKLSQEEEEKFKVTISSNFVCFVCLLACEKINELIKR
jgi:hypothetical protein